MKVASLLVAGLALAFLPIATANAEKIEDKWKCSSTTWPMVSPVQCAKPKAANYVECTCQFPDFHNSVILRATDLPAARRLKYD